MPPLDASSETLRVLAEAAKAAYDASPSVLLYDRWLRYIQELKVRKDLCEETRNWLEIQIRISDRSFWEGSD